MLQPRKMLFQRKRMPPIRAQQLKSTQPPQNRQIGYGNDGPVGGYEFTINIIRIHKLPKISTLFGPCASAATGPGSTVAILTAPPISGSLGLCNYPLNSTG
jgi:hypothetical protein